MITADISNSEILDLYISWHNDPVKLCRDLFGLTLDDWQIDALAALPFNDLVAFIASKGVGKSFLEAIAGWWWMVTRKKAQVICTSKDADNLKTGLWKEVSGLYQRSPFLQRCFEMNSEQVYAKPDGSQPWARDEWAMSAKAWRRHADAVEQAQALAGIHGDHMLWLGDEAGSYHQAIVASGSAMRANVVPGSGREAKILLGGNPTDPAGPLGKIHKNRLLWHVVTINGDPDNPKRSPRVSIEWAKQEIKEHGRDNPWVKVSVLGEFPEIGFTNLLGPADVEAALRRFYIPTQYNRAQKRMGVDVARFGDDATVLYIRQGLKAGPFWELRGLDTMQVADRVALEFKRNECEIVFVDETGSPGVVDALRRILKGIQVIGVNSSSRATDPERFYNKRAEMCWEISDWVRKDGGWIPSSDLPIQAELTAPTYNFKNGKIIIDEKKIIKENLGRSPDHYDALALTFAMQDMPAQMGLSMLHNLARQKAKDYDYLNDGRKGDFEPGTEYAEKPYVRQSNPEKLD